MIASSIRHCAKRRDKEKREAQKQAAGRRMLERYDRDMEMWLKRGVNPYMLHPSVWPGQ